MAGSKIVQDDGMDLCQNFQKNPLTELWVLQWIFSQILLFQL